MDRGEHIDEILRHWPYDPRSVSVRIVAGDDGRDVVQMRIDMGILQLEMTGCPDGTRPHGAETYLDHLLGISLHEGDDFEMTEEQCAAVDRELVQFYHRRVCWLALREYGRAIEDANHSLGLMDFCGKHSPDEAWTISHEQYRPFIMFHRAQAAALLALEKEGPEAAIGAVNQELEGFREQFATDDVDEQFKETELVTRLEEIRESLRNEYHVGPTLHEQLTNAIAAERYELAARLRDELLRRENPRR